MAIKLMKNAVPQTRAGTKNAPISNCFIHSFPILEQTTQKHAIDVLHSVLNSKTIHTKDNDRGKALTLKLPEPSMLGYTAHGYKVSGGLRVKRCKNFHTHTQA